MTIFALNSSNYILGALVLLGVSAALLLAYMLFRILNEQDNIFKEIRKGTKNLVEAGEKLHSMYSLAENLIDKIKETRPSISSQSLHDIEVISKDLMTKSIRRVESIASEMKALIDSMNATPVDELPRWRNENTQVISQLLAEQKMLAPDINKLQKSLDQIVLDLKRNNYLAVNNSSTNKELEQKLENYQSMVIKAREKSRNAEITIAELESEVTLLKSNNRSANSEPNSMIEQLQNELKKVTLEKTTLALKVESLTNEISRTRIEKDFIEDKFIELS